MTVKNLIKQLIDLPMDSEITLAIRNHDAEYIYANSEYIYLNDNGNSIFVGKEEDNE